MSRSQFACCPISQQTFLEEIFNSITHGIGLLLSVVGLPVIIVLASLYGDVWHIVSCSIYGATLVMLYAASTCYHACRKFHRKQIGQIFDHIGIYLLIAGSYTPFTLVTLRGAWGWSMFGVIWGLAFTGLVMSFALKKFEVLETVIYLIMGWISMIAVIPLLKNLHIAGFALLAAGGIMYSLGTIFYLWKKLPFNHTIWHLFVLAGSICHYCAISFYVIPILY